uniref:OB domain-containing protein n=2 Tax=Ditylenchus dipsaci TaxID=166011 RepID=A0A915E438_9BILA
MQEKQNHTQHPYMSVKQILDTCASKKSIRRYLKRDCEVTSSVKLPIKKPRKAKKILMKYNKIKTLCPSSTNWRIHGKVTSKDKNLKEMQNGCKYFAFVLTDEGASINVCAFGEEAKKFYPVLQNDQWITITGGVVKAASNDKYNTTNHRFQVTLRSQSQIAPDPNHEEDIDQNLDNQ